MIGTTRYTCPHGDWTHDIDRSVVPNRDEVEAVLTAHLDEVHPGWTLEGLRELVEQEADREAIRLAFGVGPAEMFG